jgi:MFS family permease
MALTMSITVSRPPERAGAITALFPIMTAVFVAFLVTGLSIPVVPLHVHQGLGLGAFMVGLVAGSQFAASLFSRIWAGHYSDRRGAKRAVVAGLIAAVAAGFLYLLSLQFVAAPLTSVTILLLGRGLLGAAESLIITGSVSWGLGLVAGDNTGKVIAWVGMAMFAALALGAPIGTTLYAIGGFAALALATSALPLLTILMVAALPSVPPRPVTHLRLIRVAGAVWMPGLASAMSSIGFGAIIAFSSLFFAERGWNPVWLAFSAFAAALIAACVLLGHLPDKFGGARVALVFVLIEAAGLSLLWLASSAVLAATGAALAGFGYSLVYPGLGAEAVRRAPLESRGLAMGIYTAFLDLALAFGSPLLGVVAGRAGLRSVFLASALIVLGTAAIAIRLPNGRGAQ